MSEQTEGGKRRAPLGQLIARAMLRLTGWQAGPFPDIQRAVIAGGPHTSNWDGVLALVSRSALQQDVNVMIKHSLFKGPLGWLLHKLGAMPIERGKAGGMVEQTVALVVYGWPDGVAQALEWRGGSRTGEQGQFAATVANEGADRLAGTAILELDGRVLRTWEVTLEPEENLTLLAEWTAQPGRHAVTLFLELVQDELELANNQLALNLTIATAEQGLPLLALVVVALGVVGVVVTGFFYWKRPPGKQSADDAPLPPPASGGAEEPVEAIVVEDDAWRRQD